MRSNMINIEIMEVQNDRLKKSEDDSWNSRGIS